MTFKQNLANFPRLNFGDMCPASGKSGCTAAVFLPRLTLTFEREFRFFGGEGRVLIEITLHKFHKLGVLSRKNFSTNFGALSIRSCFLKLLTQLIYDAIECCTLPSVATGVSL